MADLAAARRFVHREARLIDRLMFDAAFDGGAGAAVLAALRPYQNPDGGFGHALEPDTRSRSSQPLYFELALEYMDDAKQADVNAIERACAWLSSVISPAGGAPILLDTFRDGDFATHWAEGPGPPSINPNGGIAGRLRKLGVEHPILARLEDFCWRAIEGVDGAHNVSEALIFLEHVSDRARAHPIAERLVQNLPRTRLFKADPAAPGYGLDALFYARSPQSWVNRWLDPSLVRTALDHLGAGQQDDGGWPITWVPPGSAAASEWRGLLTVRAARTLRAYGRL